MAGTGVAIKNQITFLKKLRSAQGILQFLVQRASYLPRLMAENSGAAVGCLLCKTGNLVFLAASSAVIRYFDLSPSQHCFIHTIIISAISGTNVPAYRRPGQEYFVRRQILSLAVALCCGTVSLSAIIIALLEVQVANE